MTETNTPETITVLFVPAGGIPEVLIISSGLKPLQDLVGGYVEGISPSEGDWYAYCNEEGKLIGAGRNLDAEVICRANGVNFVWDYIAGPVVFVGDNGSGDSIDVPARFHEYAN